MPEPIDDELREKLATSEPNVSDYCKSCGTRHMPTNDRELCGAAQPEPVVGDTEQFGGDNKGMPPSKAVRRGAYQIDVDDLFETSKRSTRKRDWAAEVPKS